MYKWHTVLEARMKKSALNFLGNSWLTQRHVNKRGLKSNERLLEHYKSIMNPTSCSIMGFMRNRSAANNEETSSTISSEPNTASVGTSYHSRDDSDTSNVLIYEDASKNVFPINHSNENHNPDLLSPSGDGRDQNRSRQDGARTPTNEEVPPTSLMTNFYNFLAPSLTVNCDLSDQLCYMKPISSSTYISPYASTFMTQSILRNQHPLSQHPTFANDQMHYSDNTGNMNFHNTGSRDTENIKEKQRQAIRELEELVEKKRAEISQMRRKLDEKERLKFSQSRSLAEKIIIKRNEKIALSIDCHLLEMELDQRDAPPSSTDYDGSTGSRSRLGSKINPGEENTAQILDAIPACADHQLSRYNEAVRRQSHQGIIGSSNTTTSGSPGSQRKLSYIPVSSLVNANYPMHSSNSKQQASRPPYPEEERANNKQQPTRPDHFVGGLKQITNNLGNKKL